jgi:hypothetical protein
VEHGALQPVIEIASQAVRDEVHHAQISVELAARYRGDAVLWPKQTSVHIPELAPATGALKTTLHMIAMCCINETLACTVLELALSKAKSPLVRAGIQSILRDEIEHARAGWIHLASPLVNVETKRVLGLWVRRLLSGKLTSLLEDDAPMPGEAFPDHGMLTRADFRSVARATLNDVILPGLESVGIDPEPASKWAVEAFASF